VAQLPQALVLVSGLIAVGGVQFILNAQGPLQDEQSHLLQVNPQPQPQFVQPVQAVQDGQVPQTLPQAQGVPLQLVIVQGPLQSGQVHRLQVQGAGHTQVTFEQPGQRVGALQSGQSVLQLLHQSLWSVTEQVVRGVSQVGILQQPLQGVGAS